MKLVTVPAGVFQHPQFREPLGDEVVVANHSGPCEGSGHPRGPLNLELNRIAGTNRSRERQFCHCPVVGITIVRRNEAELLV